MGILKRGQMVALLRLSEHEVHRSRGQQVGLDRAGLFLGRTWARFRFRIAGSLWFGRIRLQTLGLWRVAQRVTGRGWPL